jgi:hypothetical protein
VGGRLVAVWVEAFKAKTGQSFPQSDKGRLGSTLKTLASDFGEPTVMAAVGGWFGASRKEYGMQLFCMKLKGGDAELLGRAASGPGGGDGNPDGFAADHFPDAGDPELDRMLAPLAEGGPGGQ